MKLFLVPTGEGFAIVFAADIEQALKLTHEANQLCEKAHRVPTVDIPTEAIDITPENGPAVAYIATSLTEFYNDPEQGNQLVHYKNHTYYGGPDQG